VTHEYQPTGRSHVHTAGVLLYWSRRDRARTVTVVGAVGLALAGAMAIFGLPAVDLHGPLHRLGIMDPLCGGTRAARLAAEGHLGEAWRYNPLGIFAVLAAGVAVSRLAVGVIVRRWLTVQVRWTPRLRRIAMGVAVLLLALLEIRQQGRAELLLQPY